MRPRIRLLSRLVGFWHTLFHKSRLDRELDDELRAAIDTLAERYVRETRQISTPLKDIRFHAKCPRGQGPFTRFEPALIVAMRRAGELAAIQRIFLDPATANYTAKLCLGSAIGAAWPSW